MEHIKPFEPIIAMISGFITIIGAILWIIPLVKYSVRKFTLQLTLVASRNFQWHNILTFSVGCIGNFGIFTAGYSPGP